MKHGSLWIYNVHNKTFCEVEYERNKLLKHATAAVGTTGHKKTQCEIASRYRD